MLNKLWVKIVAIGVTIVTFLSLVLYQIGLMKNTTRYKDLKKQIKNNEKIDQKVEEQKAKNAEDPINAFNDHFK